jgi:hypothetical protein
MAAAAALIEKKEALIENPDFPCRLACRYPSGANREILLFLNSNPARGMAISAFCVYGNIRGGEQKLTA